MHSSNRASAEPAVSITDGRIGSDTVHGRVGSSTAEFRSNLALSDDSHTLSYGDLDVKANALAHQLRQLGVVPGVRVGLCHERSVVNVVAVLAAWKAGGAYIGLDPADPDERLMSMVRDSDALVVLTQSSSIERLQGAAEHVVDVDAALRSSTGADQPPEELATVDNVAYVVYTSGSTGVPKGVEVSHGNLLSLIDWHKDAFEVRPADRTSMVASPAFDASVWEVWPYLTTGASVHVPEGAVVTAPRALRDWLLATAITISFVPTPMAENLLGLDWPDDGALRIMLTGGDVLHRRPSASTPFTVVNNYGVTEATVVSTSGAVAAGVGPVPSIGKAISGTRLHVLDGDLASVAPGQEGELFIGGAGVALGYVNRPAETAERFLADPFSDEPGARLYRTGDSVRMGYGGDVEFLGRLDTQVQIRGHRVELDGVAAALMTHRAVDRCVVVARGDCYEDQRLIAYLVPPDGAIPDRVELREHLAGWLPSYMIPTAFVTLAELPVTPNGKIDRDALPMPARLLAPTRPPEGARPVVAGSVEAAVIAILEELLEMDRVDPDDNFFDLGGHSLMGTQVVARLEELFDVEVDLLTIFDNPTAAGIAAVIAQDLCLAEERDP